MTDYLDEFIKDLLHLDDVRGNRLLDVGQDGSNIKSYKLYSESGSSCAKMLAAVKRGLGKVSNRTVLKNSALVKTGVDNPQVEKWLWRDTGGSCDARLLDKFITDAYSVINLKGNNPLFLGLGSITWEVAVSDEMVKVTSPLLIFPIKLIRGTATSPVEIEFVDDDAYFNPCLYERMRRELSGFLTQNFPHPNGKCAFDEPIDLEKLDLGYFDLVEEHVKNCSASPESFVFQREDIFIAQYNHSDICMYYDVRRNRANIEAHPVIRRIFGEQSDLPQISQDVAEPRFVLPKDSVQEDIVRRIAGGESLIVKGPPGTGKTLTIANMIAALIARGKSVIFASKKLSALAEVYAKLPEKLRKFTMLLDCETEQKASAVNPAEIKKELKELLKNKKEYHFDPAVSNGYERAVADCASAVLDINAYFKTVFSDGYYDCADEFLKSNLPAVEFADPKDVYAVSAKKYGELLSKVESAAKYYGVMAMGGSITDCPWFGVDTNCDLDAAIALNSDICRGLEKIKDYLSEFGDLSGLRLGDLYLAVCDNSLSREQTEKVLALGLSYTELDEIIGEYEKKNPDLLEDIEFSQGADYEKLFKVCPDLNLTCAEILSMNVSVPLFADGGKVNPGIDMPRLKEIYEKADEYEKQAKGFELDALSVLDLLKSEDYPIVKEMLPAFSKYIQSSGKAPSVFDFKVKKHLKYLALKSTESPSFADITGAMGALCKYFDCVKEREALYLLADKCFGKKLTAEEAAGVKAIAENRNGGLAEYLGAISAFAEAYGGCFKGAAANNLPVAKLQKAYAAHVAKARLINKVNDICGSAGIAVPENILAAAKSIRSVVRAGGLKQFKDNRAKLLDFLQKLNAAKDEFAPLALSVAQKLREFGTRYFDNIYTLNPWAVTVDVFDRFISQAEDRSVLNCSAGYEEILHDKANALDIAPFFAELERGNVCVPCERIGELFAHSFCKLKLDYILTSMRRRRNGLGKNAMYAFEKFEQSEAEILNCNASIIENLCMSRIDADDPDFDFLNADRGANQSLRYLFKTNADAILKLKKCFIISPSTASVLFRPEAYSRFDAVIVDEASQLEPVNLLPVLFRSKQCVLVGDEYQMPPLTHFKVKNRRIIDDDSELTLDTDISALSLALHNNALPATELVCHYRSNTEALIAFSQREFYPYMRTFPSAEPFKKGLGFEDVLTADGVCDGGVNDIEACKVVEILEDHFKEYFDGKRLSKSVGVVAFGEAQLKRILVLIQKNAALSEKIETALGNFDDVPEKLIFFRTIESVQGQETDRLILSLTYGRDKDGAINLRFGELNRDALGKNIFNVAVTRAQSMVTVVHSLTAEQIAQNPRISFIADYLKSVGKFSAGGRAAFVSSRPEKGEYFVKDVQRFLTESGIEPERIVVNYGVTEGSVKIPIAVLSKDKTRAVLGIWCEYPVLKKYDYLDYNVRYVRSLVSRGWNIHRIFIHEWLDNGKFEREALLKKALAVKNI